MHSNYYYLILILIVMNLLFSIINFNIFYIVSSIIILVIILLFYKKNKLIKKINEMLILILLIVFLLETSCSFHKNKEENFINKNYNEVYNYAKKNNYKLNTNYEYSDKVKENKIIFYNKDKDIINIVVSNGINYSKNVVVPNLIGKSSNYVSEFINKNKLDNVDINYELSDLCDNNKLTKQSYYGSIRRGDNIKFTFCRKINHEQKPLEDLRNMYKYKAIIKALNKNYTYDIKYEFSSVIEKNNVIKTKRNGKNITIYISKGKVVILPDLYKMTNKEIYDFIIKNNLNVTFKYIYNEKYEKDKFIKCNKEKYEKISSLDNIVMYFSKGKLTLPNFTKLNEFERFAKTNKIKYKIKYKKTNKVKEGNIVSFNITPGSYITDKEIVVLVAKKEYIINNKDTEVKENKNENDKSIINETEIKEKKEYKRDKSILDLIK